MSIDKLPPEIRISIAENLERADLIRLSCVNRNSLALLRPKLAGYRLLCALNRKHEALAIELLNENPQIDLRVCCRRQMSAMHFASLNGFRNILQILLVDRGYKGLLDSVDLDQNTPLIYAARYSDDKTMSLLIQQGCNVNAKNAFGETALHLSSSNGNDMAVNRLLEADAAVSLTNAAGMTPLWYTARRQYVSIARCLILAGSPLTSKNANGETELHLATRFDNFQLSKLFLEHGADPSATDIAGWTPLIWAARNGNVNLASILILKGADVAASDRDGRSALDFAIQAGHTEVTRLLRYHASL